MDDHDRASGEMLHEPRAGHHCDVPQYTTPGAVWRCGTCGAYWRMHSIGLMNPPGWFPMGVIAVWRFRRQQRKRLG